MELDSADPAGDLPSVCPPLVSLPAPQAHRSRPVRTEGKKRKAASNVDSTTASEGSGDAKKTKKKRRKPKVQETDRPAVTFKDELGARGVALLEQFDQVEALYCVLVVSVATWISDLELKLHSAPMSAPPHRSRLGPAPAEAGRRGVYHIGGDSVPSRSTGMRRRSQWPCRAVDDAKAAVAQGNEGRSLSW